MKISVELHFRESQEIYLERTIVSSALLPRRLVSVRGKSAWSVASTGSFEWTSAVRALSLLLVQNAITSGFRLEGHLAQSLDYTLSKKPLWLREMFGISEGVNFCNRIFKRSRCEYSAQIVVQLKLDILPTTGLKIYSNGRLIEGTSRLLAFRDKIVLGVSECSGKSVRKIVEKGLLEELSWGLSRSDILSVEGQVGFAKRISSYTLSKKLAGYKTQNFLCSYRAPSLTGFSKRELVAALKDSEPISVEVPALAATGAAVLHRIRDWGVPLEVNFRYLAAYLFVRDLLRGGISKPPELVVLGIVPLMYLLNSPLAMEYQLLSPVGVQSGWQIDSPSADPGKVVYYTEELTNLMLVDEVTAVTPRLVENISTAQILTASKNGSLDKNAILFPPFGAIAREFGVSAYRASGDGYSGHPFFLLARKDVANTPRIKLIEQAISRAWTEIVFDEQAPKRALKSLMANEDFCSQIALETGLQSLAA